MKPISNIDSAANQLFFRGINVGDLCFESGFEEIVYLLIHGELPSKQETDYLAKSMIEFRGLYSEDIDSLHKLAWSLEAIREENDLNLTDTLLVFTSLIPLVVANEFGIAKGCVIQKPKKNLQHAANFLWMTKGVIPSKEDLRDFQTSLILHMDDPQNPSLSALQDAIRNQQTASEALSSALSAHSGQLHHGAGTEAMTMFAEVREQSNIKNYLRRRVDSGKKIFGLGHRIYTGTDPRAMILREMLERRVKGTHDEWLLGIADTVAREGSLFLKQHKGIAAFPNIDLYNAAVYFTLGFPPELNTSLFAMARAAGWTSHILELESE